MLFAALVALYIIPLSVSLPQTQWLPVSKVHPETLQNITKVYLISSCHLDLGFANSLVNIVNEYFDKHFPNAISISNILRKMGKERLVFTTHSYLVWLYLNCPITSGLHCPSESDIDKFIEAVKNGDIVWHAFPFNAQPEVYDRSMVDFGFRLTRDISEKLGFIPNTMSQRDVPGLTRSIIPIMNSNGIKAITVGVNTACMPPAVPTAFNWIDKISNTSILAMWHPHGYGGQNGVGLDSTVIVDGMSSALAFAIRVDNSGPPSALEVLRNYEKLHSLFPNAEIVASSYNEFVNDLEANSDLLEEYTEEIGDTWIHGVASDPWRTIQFREIIRTRADCFASGSCNLLDERIYNFSAILLKYGEHTWGKDVKTFLHDFKNWNNSLFHPLMYTASNYLDIANSWIEQRDWSIKYALEALEDHPLRKVIETKNEELKFNGRISLSDYKKEQNCTDFTHGKISFKFDEQLMCISSLQDLRGDSVREFGGFSYPLALLQYNAYTQDDYEYFLKHYLLDPRQSYAYLDLGKPGLNHTKHISIGAAPIACWSKVDPITKIASLIIEGTYIKDNVFIDYGASERIWLEVSLPEVVDPSLDVPIDITVYVVNKTPTRIPESLSLYFRFNDELLDVKRMLISKLGEYVSVLDVIKNGSKHVHASDEGIKFGGSVPLSVKAWDTNVVSTLGTILFPGVAEDAAVGNEFSFNMFNNLWGTNYIMWYPFLPGDESSKYRFTITLPSK